MSNSSVSRTEMKAICLFWLTVVLGVGLMRVPFVLSITLLERWSTPLSAAQGFILASRFYITF